MNWLIGIVGGLAFVGAIGVIFSRQTLYSALSLVMTVGMLAVLYLILNAQFLFVVQLIVYAGAVMVLFVFIIALLSPEAEDAPAFDARMVTGLLIVVVMSVAAYAVARNGITHSDAGFHGAVVGQTPCPQGSPVSACGDPYNSFSFDQSDSGNVNQAGNVQTVGGQLFTTYLLPFEVTSLLLLVAAIGAVYLTRRGARRRTEEIRRMVVNRRRTAPLLEEERVEAEVS